LNEVGIQGSVDAVPDGFNRACEGRAVSFHHESVLSEGWALLGGRGFRCGFGVACSWCRLCC
jgi:hypothetical protein